MALPPESSQDFRSCSAPSAPPPKKLPTQRRRSKAPLLATTCATLSFKSLNPPIPLQSPAIRIRTAMVELGRLAALRHPPLPAGKSGFPPDWTFFFFKSEMRKGRTLDHNDTLETIGAL